jgi:hypothetical protein
MYQLSAALDYGKHVVLICYKHDCVILLTSAYGKNLLNCFSGKTSGEKLMIDKLLARDAPAVLDLFEDKCCSRLYPPSNFQV